MSRTRGEIPIEDFYSLKLSALAKHFIGEHFSLWMICGYLVIEYVRPQSIIVGLDIIPWAQVFLIAAVAGKFAESGLRWVSNPANKWLTLFFLIILLSSATAVFPEESWLHINDYLTWYVIYFLIVNIVTTEKRLLIFIAIFLIASFKLSFFGARAWAMSGFAFSSWGIMGPPGFFANSGELAIQMLMFGPIAYELAMFARPYAAPWRRRVLLAFPITAALTVMGASSRGSQIGLVYQLYRTLVKRRVNVKTVLLVASLIGAGLVLLPEEQKARFTAAGTDRTSQQRLLYWRHGTEMIGEHPWLGVGFFNFSRYYETHYREDMLYEHAQLPHNIFVQVGTDSGLLGLGVYLMIVYAGFRNSRTIRELCRTREEPWARLFERLATGFATAAWGFIVAGQFVSVAYYPFLWINLAMTVALRNVVEQRLAEASSAGQAIATRDRRRQPNVTK